MVSTRLVRGSLIAALLALAGLTATQAAPVTIKVVAARNEPALVPPVVTCALSGTQICQHTTVVSDYKYIINIDNTGTTEQRGPNDPLHPGCSPQDAGYPDSCHWTSIAGAATSSPVYVHGDQADFASAMNIPDGRYLISVLADGYKLDGRHFTVDSTKTPSVIWEGMETFAPAPAVGEVVVELQPAPLPDAQIQAAVFEDVSPVNSAPDVPAENGLAGFQGHITDTLGEVTTNVYGDPLCTRYERDAQGALVLDADGAPIAIPGSGGKCLSMCYVVDGGEDVGTVRPVDAAGRCPIPVINDATGAITPAIAMFDLTGTVPNGNVPDTAAIEGKVKIPNLGTNRYALSVTPPDGSGWVQTTTLEGNHDWDAWVMEGATGLDTEFIVAGEPFPAIIFGYVPVPGTPSAVGSALPEALSGTGTITGVVDFVKIYVPTTGGVPGLPGAIWGGLQGAVIDKPIEQPWVTLTDLGNGDTILWAGQGDANGKFSIPNVPAGTYTLTWWDEPQNTILDLVNVTVSSGETVDMGVLPLSGWWTEYDGYVFDDANRNGVMDAGEKGLAGYTLTMRRRENSLMDRGSTAVTTDANGYYKFEAAYPMTQWLVEEAYDDLHYTTGITYQADNQPTPTTIIGAGVDVSVHPIIGLSGRLDWGKHTYDPLGRNGIDPRNGGIVGTVTYDTTRNELDPRYAAVEDWQPSVPNLVMRLYKPLLVTSACPLANRLKADGSNAATATCDLTGRYQLDPATKAIAHGPLLNTYLTETWQRPVGCVARGADGAPLIHGTDEKVLPLDDPSTNSDPGTWKGCIEAPLMGVQFAAYETDQGTPDANFGATVDGNYGFGDYCTGTLDDTDPSAPDCNGGTFAALAGGDYLVQVDLSTQTDALGRPIYNVTREEDINIGNGDAFVPAVPPSACAGALHTVDVAGIAPDGPDATVNPTFAFDVGGSPYEGMKKPLCDVKLVSLSNGKSIAPAFNLFTDVPLPGRHWFIIIDDLNFSSNQQSMTYGEKAGMPFVPVGIYDYTDRLVKTVESDYNGLADVLLPSTNRINCPTPSGVCTNLYRYVGNDPGIPGRLNPNYNPTFRTIAAEFEVMPGSIIPADLAPTQVGVTVQLPGGQNTTPFSCKLDVTTPQLYAVSQPYAVRPAAGAPAVPVTIKGVGFGSSGQVTLDGVALGTTSWSDTQIVANITSGTAYGPHQMMVRANNGQSTVNGLTFHVVSTSNTGNNYNPVIFEVGPGKTFAPAETLPLVANHAIQRALDAPYPAGASSTRPRLVVVYPNLPSANPRQNPRGAYYENLIVTRSVKLQGVGPGSPDGTVQGSIIDGGAFAGDSPVATDWATRINAATWDGNQTVYDGAVVSIYVPSSGNGAFPGTYSANTAPSIDGFDLRGGDQAGFPGNINAIGGGPTGQPGGLITQGGAIFANAYARNLQITNNVVQNNGGAYGTIRIGTPDLTGPDADNNNDNVVIAYNRVIANAGTNQAGAIGLFRGADSYLVAHNDICGNFSAEYGGGISAVGRMGTNNGQLPTIDSNRIYSNRSYDEGGGIMIAGALPANTSTLSPGSGAVRISNNLIQSNLANDDGGGLRFLMSGNFPMDVYNNIIVNNISTHEGGGISINDAPNVRVFNNTIMKNMTTATAITSSGNAAPAGLSSSVNSALLQATLPAGSPTFSNPLLFNNIFWDNRSGTRGGTGVVGLGNLADCTTVACAYWDVGVADSGDLLSPTNSVLQTAVGTNASPTNAVGVDPAVKVPYDVGVTFNAWRNNPAFLGAIMISADLTPNLMGDYHLAANSSPAFNLGAASKTRPSYQVAGNQNAPTNDIDGDVRPALGGFDAGADEIRAPTADLGITITDGLATVQVGQVVNYTVTVSNAGPDPMAAAPVTFTTPRLSAVSWTCASGCAATSGTGNTTVSLASGASLTLTLTGTVTSGGGSVVTTAAVAVPALSVDPNPGNNSGSDTDTVVVAADLAISVTDVPAASAVNRGAALRYSIVVSNVGASTVTGAVVNNPFTNTLTGTINWTCATTGSATCGGGATGSGTINRTVNMPAGSTITFTTTSGTVSANTAATSISDTATVAVPAGYTDSNPANNSATDTDTINGFHIQALTGTAANASTTLWTATVTLTVHTATHAPAVGVSVTGAWVAQGAGSGNCTTNASGQCTLTRTGISRTGAAGNSATYAVTGLTLGANGYQISLNEGSTSVTVLRSSAPAAALLRPAAIGRSAVTGQQLGSARVSGQIKRQ